MTDISSLYFSSAFCTNYKLVVFLFKQDNWDDDEEEENKEKPVGECLISLGRTFFLLIHVYKLVNYILYALPFLLTE